MSTKTEAQRTIFIISMQDRDVLRFPVSVPSNTQNPKWMEVSWVFYGF